MPAGFSPGLQGMYIPAGNNAFEQFQLHGALFLIAVMNTTCITAMYICISNVYFLPLNTTVTG